MIQRFGLLFAVSALAAGCAPGAIADRSYPATHPASADAPVAPFVRPANVLAGNVPFPAVPDREMTTGHAGTDHATMNHGHAGVDHSARGRGAAKGQADTNPSGESQGSSQTAQADSAATQPRGSGTINAADAERRTVNISHEPIPAIGWPAMTMDMAVAPAVGLGAIAPGSRVTFTLARGADGVYVIDSLRTELADGATPGVDHGGTDHGGSIPGMGHQ